MRGRRVLSLSNAARSLGLPRRLPARTWQRLRAFELTDDNIEWLLATTPRLNQIHQFQLFQVLELKILLACADFAPLLYYLSSNFLFAALVDEQFVLGLIELAYRTHFEEYYCALGNILFERADMALAVPEQLFSLLESMEDKQTAAYICYTVSKLGTQAVVLYQPIKTFVTNLLAYQLNLYTGYYVVLTIRNLVGVVDFFDPACVLLLAWQVADARECALVSEAILYTYLEDAEFPATVQSFPGWTKYCLERLCCKKSAEVLKALETWLII